MSEYQTKLWGDRPTRKSVLAVFTPDAGQLTRAEIAARMGLVRKNKLFIAILENLVDEGVVLRHDTVLYNGAHGFMYELA